MQQRSKFVTVVAWIFIALSVAGVMLSLLQFLIFEFFFSRPEFSQALDESAQMGVFPPGYFDMLDKLPIFVAIFSAWCLLHLMFSVGLLKRINLARIFFLGSLALGIVYNIGSMVWTYYLVSDIKMPGQDERMQEFVDKFNTLGLASSAVFNILVGVAIVWLIWKLSRPEIRAEFTTQTIPPTAASNS